jgi:tRNA pseudouridine38-40 synthase
MILLIETKHITRCISLYVSLFFSKLQESLRYFIELSYNGQYYHGWQHQPDAVTVQDTVENALSTILRNQISIVGAGRTDAGVHARKMVVHTDIDELTDVEELIFKLNSFLPKDISIHKIYKVNPKAHARFDAIGRTYQYHITGRKDPFLNGYAYYLHQLPDFDILNEASKVLLDYNDFQCFSRSKTDVKTYHCTIKEAVWTLKGDRLTFTISADRFLRNMVRAIVGTLLEVGFGTISIEKFHGIIQSKDRNQAGTSVPAHGLYLTEISYPKEIIK